MESMVLDKLPSIERCMNRLDGAEPIDPSSLIAHIHIPKTAGMAVQTVLKEHLNPHTHLSWNRAAEEWEELTDGKDYPGRMITGHLRFHQLFYPGFQTDRSIYCISVVRDPLKRVISLYNYNRSRRHPNHARFSGRFPTINDFISAKFDRFNTGNHQAFWLCGNASDPEVLSAVLNERYIGLTTQDHLTDYLSKVLKVLGEDPGSVSVPTVNSLQSIKSGHVVGKDDIDPDILQRFIQDNQLDFLLFNTVSEHLKKHATPDTKTAAQASLDRANSAVRAVKRTVKRLLRD